MLKINRRTDYAIRVVIALAKRPAGTRISSKKIKDEMLIPRPFLQRIIAELSQAGIIHTYTGPNGGIQLSRPAEQINLKDILEVMEGQLCISQCLYSPEECPLSTTCPVRNRWGHLQEMILQELTHTTMAHLARESVEDSTLKINPEQILDQVLPIAFE